MASSPSKLAGYITTEIVKAFNMGSSNPELDKYAQALANAIHKYATTDLEVDTKIQVDGTVSIAIPSETPGEDSTTEIFEVKGQTVTKGKVI